MSLLKVENLKVKFNGSVGNAVENISFAMGKSQTMALVGESGSGKTVTALSILRLTQNTQTSGKIWLDG